MFYSIKIFAENLQVKKIVATFAPALRDKRNSKGLIREREWWRMFYLKNFFDKILAGIKK